MSFSLLSFNVFVTGSSSRHIHIETRRNFRFIELNLLRHTIMTAPSRHRQVRSWSFLVLSLMCGVVLFVSQATIGILAA